MRAGGRAALVVALALGACRSRAPEAATDAGGLALRDSGSAPLPGCETLLPADTRDLTLPGFTLKEEHPCPMCGPLCTLRSASEQDVSASVTWDCQPRFARTEPRLLLAPSLAAGGVEVPALGRAAARRNPVQGMTQVVAWDDDTPCALVVTWLGGDPERALDLARTALTATTPAVLEAAARHGDEDGGDMAPTVP